MEDEHSPRSPRGEAVNGLTYQQLESVIKQMRVKGTIVSTPRGEKCTLACTKDAKGNPKHAQVSMEQFNCGITKKQLVHLIYWRYVNNGAIIDPELHISHLDADQQMLNLIQETREMNESRKYCHLLGWYKKKPNESRRRCPHWENPCTGAE